MISGIAQSRPNNTQEISRENTYTRGIQERWESGVGKSYIRNPELLRLFLNSVLPELKASKEKPADYVMLMHSLMDISDLPLYVSERSRALWAKMSRGMKHGLYDVLRTNRTCWSSRESPEKSLAKLEFLAEKLNAEKIPQRHSSHAQYIMKTCREFQLQDWFTLIKEFFGHDILENGRRPNIRAVLSRIPDIGRVYFDDFIEIIVASVSPSMVKDVVEELKKHIPDEYDKTFLDEKFKPIVLCADQPSKLPGGNRSSSPMELQPFLAARKNTVLQEIRRVFDMVGEDVTSRQILKWLRAHHITDKEIVEWAKNAGMPVGRCFDTRGFKNFFYAARDNNLQSLDYDVNKWPEGYKFKERIELSSMSASNETDMVEEFLLEFLATVQPGTTMVDVYKALVKQGYTEGEILGWATTFTVSARLAPLARFIRSECCVKYIQGEESKIASIYDVWWKSSITKKEPSAEDYYEVLKKAGDSTVEMRELGHLLIPGWDGFLEMTKNLHGCPAAFKPSEVNKVVETYANFTWDDWCAEVRHFVETHKVEGRFHEGEEKQQPFMISCEEVGGESKAAAWHGKLPVKDFLSIVAVNLKGHIAKAKELAKILEDGFDKYIFAKEYESDIEAFKKMAERIAQKSIVMGPEGRAIRFEAEAQSAHLNARALQQGEAEPEIGLPDIVLIDSEPRHADASLGQGVNDRVMPERSAGQGPR